MNKTESMISRFKAVKTLPHVAMKLVRMIGEDSGTARDYEEVIRNDPYLVMRVFKLVNSAYFSLPEKIEDLSEALMIIGLNNLRNMVVIEALQEIYKGRMSAGSFSGKALWEHCLATGLCCRMISEQIFYQNGEEAFLCGLFHDVGLIVEFQAAPELFKTMSDQKKEEDSIVEHENRILGTDHTETGFLLAKEWKLPAAVQFAIRDHHREDPDILPSSITGIIKLGDFLASRSGYMVHPEGIEPLCLSLAVHLEKNIDSYTFIKKELASGMKKTKEIYST